MRFTLRLLVLTLVLSCTAIPPQPSYPIPRRPEGGVAEAKHGKVLGSSFDQINVAFALSRSLDRYFEAVAERLGYRRETPLEVWLDPEWASAATAFDTCIVVNPRMLQIEEHSGAATDEMCVAVDPRLLQPGQADGIMAHELTHWHAMFTPLRNLPQVAYEGLACKVVAEVVPGWDAAQRAALDPLIDAARARGDLPDLLARADMDVNSWTTPPFDERLEDLYALGFRLVDRIGIDPLIDAAEKGPVTLEEILAMAGVGPDGSGL